MKASKFFNRKDKARILDAIRGLEMVSSAEIRLHVDTHCESEALKRAEELFYLLHMDQTENRNGVLIYMSVADKKVSIIGDSGIDELTPEGYWEDELARLIEHFRRDDYTTGLVKCILSVGEKLAVYFPVKDEDVNELSDEISYYDN